MRLSTSILLCIALLAGLCFAATVYLDDSSVTDWTGSCSGSECYSSVSACRIPLSGLLTVTPATECNVVFLQYNMPNWTLTMLSGDLTVSSGTTVTTTSSVGSAGYGWTISSSGKVKFEGFNAQLSAPAKIAAAELHISNSNITSAPGLDSVFGLLKIDSTAFSLLNISNSDITSSKYTNLINIGYSPLAPFNVTVSSTNFSSTLAPQPSSSALFLGVKANRVEFSKAKFTNLIPVTGMASSTVFNNSMAWNMPGSMQSAIDELSFNDFMFSLSSTSGSLISGLPAIQKLSMIDVTGFTAVDNILISTSGLHKVWIERCSWSGAVLLNALSTDSNVSISVKSSVISATQPGQIGLLIKGPNVGENNFVELDLQSNTFSSFWNGHDIYLGGNISFNSPLVLSKVSHYDSPLSLFGPSVEILESLIGSASNVLPIKFFCQVLFHSIDLSGNIFIRDDAYTYIPSKLWRGLQVFPTMTVSSVSLRWTQTDTPAIGEPITIAYKVYGISSFDDEGNTNIDVTGSYDGDRFVIVFNPVPCPSACSSFTAITNGRSDSICASVTVCPTRFFSTTFTTSVNFNFGPLTAAANGSLTFDGAASFSESFTMDSSSTVSIGLDATVTGNVTVGVNGTLTIGGSTSVSSDFKTSEMATITLDGDVSLGSFEAGTGTTIKGSGETLSVGGSFNATNCTIELESTSGDIGDSLLLLSGAQVTLPNSAAFTATDFTMDADSELILVPSSSRRRNFFATLSVQDNTTALINVTGCADIAGTINLNISSADVNAMPPGQARVPLVHSGSGCLTSTTLLVASYANGDCKTISGQGLGQSNDNKGGVTLNALFTVDDSGCGGSITPAAPGSPLAKARKDAQTWPIIVGVVLGAVALALVLAIVIYFASPACRKTVSPFSNTKTGSTGGSITRATATKHLADEGDLTSASSSS